MVKRSFRKPAAKMEGGGLWIRLFLFSVWARIAVAHYDAAAGKDPNVAFDDYLVAITSASFAVDSFAKDLEDVMELATPSDCSLESPRSTAHQIWDQLAHNFDVTTVVGLHEDLHWLLQLRNDAVHFRGSYQAPHPSDGVYYHDLIGTYSRDAATRAIRLARDIILTCLDHPKPEHPALVEFISRSFGGASGVEAFATFTESAS